MTWCSPLTEPFETIRQQLLGYFIGRGRRSIQLSIPIANLADDNGLGGGNIRLDDKNSIAPNGDAVTIANLTGGRFHVLEIKAAKEDQNMTWNETFRVYKRYANAAFVVGSLRLLGDAAEGLLIWRSYGTEPENSITRESEDTEELWIRFVNQVENNAVMHVTVSW